ncbi:hypothetical protein MBANPS3_005746 [Mucor bainieri]
MLSSTLKFNDPKFGLDLQVLLFAPSKTTLTMPQIPAAPAPQEDVVEPSCRDYNTAILFATQQGNESGKVQASTKYILLKPIAKINKALVEYNALAHENVISKMPNETHICHAIVPPTEDFATTPSSSSSLEANLQDAIFSSHYRSLLSRRNCQELDKDLCDFLNQDWTTMPQMRFATAALMAGTILINTKTGQPSSSAQHN